MTVERGYKAGRSGGRVVLTVPNDCEGKTYTRTIWADGRIVFQEVQS